VRPTPEDVLDWANRHHQNFPIVKNNSNTHFKLPSPEALPTNVVINPKNMKILQIEAGLRETTIADAKELCASDQ